MVKRKKILFVVNDANFFISHRLPLAIAASEFGHEIHVATPYSPVSEMIIENGFHFHSIPLHRSSTYVWQDIRTFQSLVSLYRKILPDLIHHVTIKPVLYGGLAARLTRMPAVIHAIPGLGHVFLEGGLLASVLRFAVKLIYRSALSHPRQKVIFQNPDDQILLIHEQMVKESGSVLIRGSGVDMKEFSPLPEKDGPPVVILASRMLWSKGVGEFVKAAQLLHDENIYARFVLVGDSDPGNPSCVAVKQLEQWHESGVVEWWGACDDMPKIFAESSVVCLPSYREGLPKVLIEAAACGRPIVTTDVPGCREIVHQDENGLLVPPRDVSALAEALRRLILSQPLRQNMGARGRAMAVAEFSLERVVNETLAVYAELLASHSSMESSTINIG